jgi:proteasome lid subunit RPN8/RPN11
MSDTRFGSWSVAESPVTVEYSLVVIEEIRHEVAEGFQKLSRGGVEVGGILYGEREGDTVRIRAMRAIACEHAHGPAFLLSDTDKQILEEQLEHELEDPRLADMICLGWFSSHTRSEIVMAKSDLEIYDQYFSSPWQVTLVIRPGRGGTMRAGFFVREDDGTVRSESSYLEFSFPDRLAGVLDRPPRGDRPAVVRRPAVSFPESSVARESSVAVQRDETQPAAAPIPGPQLLSAPPPRSKWLWLTVWGALVLGIVILGLRYFVEMPRVEPLALALVEHNGQLQVEWNHSARPVTSAVRGALTIRDGQAPRTFPLTPQDLAHGAFTYRRASDDVEVRMSVENAGGEKVEETTTFLGAAPVQSDSEEKAKAEKERGDLQAEIKRLQQENASQAARIQELERNLKILQSRLGAQ